MGIDPITAWLTRHGYEFHYNLYGKEEAGHMGVLTAWYTKYFGLVEIEEITVSKTIQFPREIEIGIKAMEAEILKCEDKTIFDKSLKGEELEMFYHYESSKCCNVALVITLKHKQTGRLFSLVNYHMPCKFYAPSPMVQHAQAMLRICKASLGKDVDFVLFNGDFNVLPNTTVYNIMADKMSSVSMMAQGKEPDSTNNVQTY